MARHYVGINQGGGFDPAGVTTGTVELASDVQISTLDGAGLTSAEMIRIIETFEAYFVENPPTP